MASRRKKILSLIMSVLLAFGMVQVPVSAGEEFPEETFAAAEVPEEGPEEGSVPEEEADIEESGEAVSEEAVFGEESSEQEGPEITGEETEFPEEAGEVTEIPAEDGSEEETAVPEETGQPETEEPDEAEASGDDIELPEVGDEPQVPAYSYDTYTKVLTVFEIGEDYTLKNKPAWYDLSGKVKKVVFTGNALNAERIGDMSFRYFTALEEIVLPAGVKEIGHEAFYRTERLKTLDIPETVEVFGGYAIAYSAVAELHLSAAVREIGNMALYSYALKDIWYGGTYEQWQALEYKSHNANVHASDFDEIRVQSLTLEVPKTTIPVGSRMQITPVILPEDSYVRTVETWSYYPQNIVSVDEYGMLTALNPGKVTVNASTDRENGYASVEITVIANSGKTGKLNWQYESGVLTLSGTGPIPDYTSSAAPWASFADDVEKVILGDKVTAVGTGAFKDMTALKAVSLPAGVTAVRAHAFEGSGVESITLSPGVRTIGADAFKDTPLNEVCFTGSEEQWNAIDIQDETILSGETLVYIGFVPVSEIRLNIVSKIVYDLMEEIQLIPQILPEEATLKQVRFTSDNETVAEVDELGNIFINGYGTAVITVTSYQNPGAYDIFTLTVRQPQTMGAVSADTEPGVVESGTLVSLSAETEGARIWYSLDGVTVPSPDEENCFLYSEPLSITENTVIMARAFKDGYTTDETVYTFTYTMKDAEQLIENEEDYKRYLELPEDVRSGIWVGGMPYEEEIIYTGSPLTFGLRIYEGTKLLADGKDYKITYKNNTKAFTGSLEDKKAPVLTLAGLGGYKFTFKLPFRIFPKDISDTSGDIIIKQTVAPYSNKKQNPVPEITHVSGSRTLKYNTDFTVAEYENKNGLTGSGSYTLTISGKGNYTGTVTAENIVVIVEPDQVSVSKLTIGKIAACTFDPFAENYACTPKLTVKNGKKVLEESTDGVTGDYTVTYQNNTKPGTATVIVNGIGEQFLGSKKATFTIKAVSLSSIKLKNKSFTYNRKPHSTETELVYKKGGQSMTLQEGVHYMISRKEVTNAGKYTVTYTAVKGSGFTGSTKRVLTVNKAKLTSKNSGRVKVIFWTDKPEVPYSKDGAKVDIRVFYYAGDDTSEYGYYSYISDPSVCIPLVEGKDYKITYKNNKTVTKNFNNPAVATVTGIGNYTGSVSFDFWIIAAESQYLRLTAADRTYSGKAGDYKSAPKVYDGSKLLKAGTDYQKVFFTAYYYEYDTTLANGIVRAAGTKVGLFDLVPSGTTIRVTMRFQLKGKYVSSSYSVMGIPVPYTEMSATYRVVSGSLANAKCRFSYHGHDLAGPDFYYYNGQRFMPGKDSMEITVNGYVLKSSDYRIVSYGQNTDAFNTKKKNYGTVTIEGTGNYTGKAVLKFRITHMAHVVTTMDAILELFGYRRVDGYAVPVL